MNRNRNFILALIGCTILASCGSSESSSADERLEDLISERDSLKLLITAVNEKIAKLDTAVIDNYPIVSAEKVQIKDFVHKIEIQGAVDTDKNALINAEMSGTIRKIHVDEGQKVKEGQALLTIDATILSSQIQEIETQLELATFMYEKQKKLMEEGVGTEIQFEQAKAQKNALEKSVETMRNQKGKTIVRAPFTGFIDEVMVSLGEFAAPGVPLLRIVDNKNVKITASLSENLLSKVHVGTEVDLLIPSLNDTLIKSKITTKGNFIDPVNRTFRIIIKLTNNKLLLPNQLAKVNVTDFSKKEAMVLSSEAILQDTRNNNYVFVLKELKTGDFRVSKVFVDVIKSFKGEVCIQPLVAGELTKKSQVVVKGAKGITESDIVNVQ